MQKQERIRHLLRRFGLGAAPKEVRYYEQFDLDEVIDRIINFEAVEDPYPVDPWEFSTNDKDSKISTSTQNFADWWTLKMCITTRPLQEKLALFWHDHFAVSEDKVQDGQKMLPYLQILRNNAAGNFATMFREVSKTPAMVVWLDTYRDVKGTANENFAREVMELFTLGVDNGYTENDIREAARAFTGWTLRSTLNYGNRNKDPILDQQRRNVEAGKDMFEFFFNARVHDTDRKTIFGKTGDFDGDGVLQLLLDHPSTPRLICGKLWAWFAYDDPEDEVVERLAKIFLKNDYEIKPVLREIASSAEFYSPKAVMTKVKSPVDFTVGLMRQFDSRAVMEKRRPGPLDPLTPIHPAIRNFARSVYRQINRQGLPLLHPPSVEGWHWGTEWISSETMLYRIDLARQFFSNKGLVGPLIERSRPEIVAEIGRLSDMKVIDRLLSLLDVEMDGSQRMVLGQYARQISLNNSLYNDARAPGVLWPVLKLVFAMPEAQMC
ncbi:MAG TPA: DUF1800 domain-containing protein [Fimbriimonadaceae bacterium]|nr:DUF1800 domain-containing protein [Fimbriimonadaceae bacterium]